MSSSLTITGIQSDLKWENVPANLEQFEKKIMGMPQYTEVVVLPEMFSTGFSMQPAGLAESMQGRTIQWMKKISAQRKVILTGSLIIEEQDPVGRKRYYNRLVWMQPDGQYGFYDKRHRFAYAGEHKEFTAGSKRLIASVKGWKINLQVCYDLRFPVWARQQSQAEAPEYDVLIYVANWPDRRVHAWKTLLQARAIENQCYVVGINRVGYDGPNNYHTGESMVVGPLGEVIHQAKSEEEIFTVTLDKTQLEDVRSKLPFWKDGDGFQLLHEDPA
jgi:omega-amidase